MKSVQVLLSGGLSSPADGEAGSRLNGYPPAAALARWASGDLAIDLLAMATSIAATVGYHGRLERFRTASPCRVGSADTLAALAVFTAEAIRNAIRHAHPAGAPGTILLGCHLAANGDVMVEICDDGVGLSGGFNPARDGGMGFRIMYGIAAKLRGVLTFRSSPLGLRLRLRLPATVASCAGEDPHAPEHLLAALPIGICVTDTDGNILWFNAAAAALWGRRPPLGEKWSGAWKLRDAQGKLIAHEDGPLAAALREGRDMNGDEVVVERPDGSRLPLIVFPTLLRDATGAVTGAMNAMVEIGERKRAEQRQQMLAGEMQHRIKNLFAIARAVVAQSLRGAPLGQARSAVLGRLQALAETYDKLNAAGWQGAELSDLVRDQLFAFADRVDIDGPDIMLNPRAAQNFALAVHELATNAVKHGALSAGGGRVGVRWWIAAEDAELHFRWSERGGPPVTPPRERGFGSVVLERVIAQDFGQAPSIAFAPTGLIYELTTAFARVAAAPTG